MKKILCALAIVLAGTLSAFGQDKPKVSILGDSYSTFEGWLTPDTNAVWYSAKPDTRRTDVKSVEQTWWHIVMERMGWQLELNNSYSGSTICNTGYRGEDYTHESFVTRLEQLGSPTVILVFGGTNDSWAGSPVGDFKYDDITKADLYSFRPAVAYMLAKLKELYPEVSVYFISNNGLKDEITESVRTICDHYGVPVIQLEDIDKKNSHPSVSGMKQIADQVCAAISGD